MSEANLFAGSPPILSNMNCIMDKIASFTVNHLDLKRGVYVSRRDVTPSGDVLTTFDIRMTEPNRQPAISGESLHTIEHLVATYLRNEPNWKERVVYWGPMGCHTGNYLILQGELTSDDILPLMRDAFAFVESFNGDVPGATPRDCGNYSYMDLEEAKIDASKYLHEVLEQITPENINYPE